MTKAEVQLVATCTGPENYESKQHQVVEMLHLSQAASQDNFQWNKS